MVVMYILIYFRKCCLFYVILAFSQKYQTFSLGITKPFHM
jgi:hypothetical protein